MALSAKLTAVLSAVQTGANDFGTPAFSPNIAYLLDLASGVGAGQADQIWMDERTLASNTADLLNLTSGLVDAFGITIPIVKLTGLLLINAPRVGAANTTDITLGGTGNTVAGIMGTAASSIGPLRPGSFLFMGASALAGIATVVPSTGDLLRIANAAGAAATYQIVLIGKSA